MNRNTLVTGLMLSGCLGLLPVTAAVDDAVSEFYQKINAKNHQDNSYIIPGACEVIASFEKGFVVTENWRSLVKKDRRDKSIKLPMPWYLLWQVMEENKGNSSWGEPKPADDTNDDLKRTVWTRLDNHIVITATEEEDNLINIEVQVSSGNEAYPPLVLADPNTVSMQDIEWFVQLIKPHQASVATKVLSVEVKKEFIIDAELAYIKASRKRWNQAAAEANRLLLMEGLPAYIKEWLGWVIKGASATKQLELAEFHIAAATLDEGLLSMRKMAQP